MRDTHWYSDLERSDARRFWHQIGNGIAVVSFLFYASIIAFGIFHARFKPSYVERFEGVIVSAPGMGLETSYEVIPVNAKDLPDKVTIWHIGKPIPKASRVAFTATMLWGDHEPISYQME